MSGTPIVMENEGHERTEYCPRWNWHNGSVSYGPVFSDPAVVQAFLDAPPAGVAASELVSRTITTSRWERVLPHYMTEAEVAATMRMFYGVHVCWVGEEGNAVALCRPTRRAKAALHRLGREDLGCPVHAFAIDQMWAWFERMPAGSETPWMLRPCGAWTEGAIEVTYASELEDYKAGGGRS